MILDRVQSYLHLLAVLCLTTHIVYVSPNASA